MFAFGVRPTGQFATDEEEAAAARATGEARLATPRHLVEVIVTAAL